MKPPGCKGNIEFAKKLKPYSTQFAVAILHPGTELYKICKNNGWFKYNRWEGFSSCNLLIGTDQLSREDIGNACIRVYREFYFRGSYIWRTALKIRSLKEFEATVKSARSL